MIYLIFSWLNQFLLVELIAPFVSRITKFDLALDFDLIGYKYHALGVGRSPGVEAFSNLRELRCVGLGLLLSSRKVRNSVKSCQVTVS